MATNPKIPTVQPFAGENIPASLKAAKRWAPWEAVWNAKRQKMDKIPHHTKAPFYGLSTARPENWYTYEQALKALQENPAKFAGLGYVMTAPHGLVGVDLDDCVSAEKGIAPWAQQIVDDLQSYTEISPSGNGLRVWTTGETPQDYVDHAVGIEVYSGHEPRFLTVTGQRLTTSPDAVTVPAAEVLPALAAKYMRAKPSATIVGIRAPDVIDELALPDLSELELNSRARAFLEDGTSGGDNSRELFAAAVGLYANGLSDETVYSLLVNNPHAMEIALSHRKQDPARAEFYIWTHHCQKAGAVAASKSALFDFDSLDADVVPDMAPVATAKLATINPAADFSVDDFDDVSAVVPYVAPAAAAKPAGKPVRFKFLKFSEFKATVKPPSWLIKRVLPHAELGVMYGAPGSGKSFMALDLAMAVARGAEWRGRRVTQGAVAYVVAEGAGGFVQRMDAWGEHNGIDPDSLPFYALPQAPNFLEKQDVQDLITSLRAIPGLKLIIVDTLAQVTPGADENSSMDMGKALKYSQAISRHTTGMVLLLAHSGKDESRGVRGWSGVKGAVDVEIKVERDKEKRSATITKMKDGEGENETYPFELDSVTLGVDKDGDNVTSCVLKPGVVGEKATTSHLKGDVQKAVMRQLEALSDFGTVPINTLLQAVVDGIAQDPTKHDRRREVAMRALKTLELAGVITLAGGFVEEAA